MQESYRPPESSDRSKDRNAIYATLTAEYPKLFSATGGYDNFGELFKAQIDHFKAFGDTETWINVLQGNPGVGKTFAQNEYLIPLMQRVNEEIVEQTDKEMHLHVIGWDDVQEELIAMFNAKKDALENKPHDADLVRQCDEYFTFIEEIKEAYTLRRSVDQISILDSTPLPDSTKGYPALFHFAVGLRIVQKVFEIRDKNEPSTAIFIETVGNTSYYGPEYQKDEKKRWKIFRDYFPELLELIQKPTLRELKTLKAKPVRVSAELLTNGPYRLIDLVWRDLMKKMYQQSREEESGLQVIEGDIFARAFGKGKISDGEDLQKKSAGGSIEVVLKGLRACHNLALVFEQRLRDLGFNEDLIVLAGLYDAMMSKLPRYNATDSLESMLRESPEEYYQRIKADIVTKYSTEHPLPQLIEQTEEVVQIIGAYFPKFLNAPHLLSLLCGMILAAGLTEDIMKETVAGGTEYCVSLQNPQVQRTQEDINLLRIIAEDHQ